jgi:hypothetical protein
MKNIVNRQESSLEQNCIEFIFVIQSVCSMLIPFNAHLPNSGDEYEKIISIVKYDFHTAKNGFPETHTSQVAKLKNHVIFNFENIEALPIARIFRCFL